MTKDKINIYGGANVPFPTGNQLVSIPYIPLREWFAGQALQSFTSEEIAKDDISNIEIAEICYEMADAMLKARKEKKDE